MDLSKLGITEGEWSKGFHTILAEKDDGNSVPLFRVEECTSRDVEIVMASKSMLKALISVQRYICGEAWDDTDISAVIENATGLGWEEVKRRLEVENTGDMG